jgi:hypothetical protein
MGRYSPRRIAAHGSDVRTLAQSCVLPWAAHTLPAVRFELPGSRSGFLIEESSLGRELVVTGPWSGEAERLVADGSVDGLVLNYARGFQESDLEFLRPWPLRRLLVLDRGLRDLAAIGRLGETLESLSVEGAPGVPVDLGALPNLRWIGASWAIVEASFHRPYALDEALLVEYDARDLARSQRSRPCGGWRSRSRRSSKPSRA